MAFALCFTTLFPPDLFSVARKDDLIGQLLVIPLLPSSQVALAGLLGDNLLLRGDVPLSSREGRGTMSEPGAVRARKVMDTQRGPSGLSYLPPLTPCGPPQNLPLEDKHTLLIPPSWYKIFWAKNKREILTSY